jgi:hypothetical protein
MTIRRTLAAALATAAVAVIASAGAISSALGDDGLPGDHGLGPHKIVGTWEATVNRGPTLPPVKSLHTFTSGGSIIESGSDSLFRSPAYGVWQYVGDRTYATTQVFHRFSPTGLYLGTQRINGNRRLSLDGDSYTAVALAELRDADGNLIASLPPVAVTATRMQVQRIPNQP